MKTYLLLALAYSVQAQMQEPVTYSVCEILNRAAEGSHDIVRIRGLLDGSPFHGYVLKDSAIDNQCSAPRINQSTVPSEVLLTWEGGHGVSLSNSEKRANRKTLADLLARFRRREVAPLPFIISGKVVFRGSLMISRSPDGVYKGNGFGEMGALPAMIFVRESMPQ